MPGNLEGGRKASLTNKRRHGENFYQRIGQAGGLAKVPKGFALMPREKVVKAGAVGGSNGTRLGVKNGQGKKHN